MGNPYLSAGPPPVRGGTGLRSAVRLDEGRLTDHGAGPEDGAHGAKTHAVSYQGRSRAVFSLLEPMSGRFAGAYQESARDMAGPHGLDPATAGDQSV